MFNFETTNCIETIFLTNIFFLLLVSLILITNILFLLIVLQESEVTSKGSNKETQALENLKKRSEGNCYL